MNKKLNLITILILLFNFAIGQDKEEVWDVYMAMYENGLPGSTVLRTDLINRSPLENFSYVLVTGLTYETAREDGFPENETFPILHKVSDELIELIEKYSESIWVGSFTHNKERLEYFYVQEPADLSNIIKAFYQSNYPEYKYYINIKADIAWTYYEDFLYPNEETQNYMSDQAVVDALFEAGDVLTVARRVDHWLYFNSKADLNECMKKLEKLKFEVASTRKNKKGKLPFELIVWRKDKVDMDSINQITSELNKIAKEFNGGYDGWETFIVTE